MASYLMFNFILGCCSVIGIGMTGYLLRAGPPLGIDVVSVACLASGMIGVSLMQTHVQRSLSPRTGSKEPSLIEMLRADRRLAWMMIGCGVAGYIAAVGGMTILIWWCRDPAWASPLSASFAIFGICYTSLWSCASLELAACRRVAQRRRRLDQQLAVESLYDEELDRSPALDLRSAS